MTKFLLYTLFIITIILYLGEARKSHKKNNGNNDNDDDSDTVKTEIRNPSNNANTFRTRSRASKRPRSNNFHQPRSTQPGNFQIYQLAQSWTPAFCDTSAGKKKQECQTLGDDSWASSHLALHGLWPGYDDAHAGTKNQWPQNCNCDPATCTKQVSDSDIPDNLETYGPGYVSDNNYLADHEWMKHGTCTGFGKPYDYFKTAVDTLLAVSFTQGGEQGTPQVILDAISSGNPIAQSDLTQSYPNKVGLACSRDCRLSQITICYDGTNYPAVGSIVDCPLWTLSSSYDNSCYLNGCDQITL